jgi:hypothetical protein
MMYQGVVICVSLTQVYCGSTISERDRAVLFGREQSIGIELWLCFLSFSLLPQLAAMVVLAKWSWLWFPSGLVLLLSLSGGGGYCLCVRVPSGFGVRRRSS